MIVMINFVKVLFSETKTPQERTGGEVWTLQAHKIIHIYLITKNNTKVHHILMKHGKESINVRWGLDPNNS